MHGLHALLLLVASPLAARRAARRGVQLPLVPGGAAAGNPAGVLEVKLVRLSGLRSEDLLGQSDPYVKLRVRAGRRRSVCWQCVLACIHCASFAAHSLIVLPTATAHAKRLLLLLPAAC